MIEDDGFSEVWREIPGFPNYFVSNEFRIFSMKSKKILTTRIESGLEYVNLTRLGQVYKRSVNKLRLRAFAMTAPPSGLFYYEGEFFE